MAEERIVIPVKPVFWNVSAGKFIKEIEENYNEIAERFDLQPIMNKLISLKDIYGIPLIHHCKKYIDLKYIDLTDINEFLEVLKKCGSEWEINPYEVAELMCAYIDTKMIKTVGKIGRKISVYGDNRHLKTYGTEKGIFIGTGSGDDEEYSEKIDRLYIKNSAVLEHAGLIIDRISFSSKPQLYKGRPLL